MKFTACVVLFAIAVAAFGGAQLASTVDTAAATSALSTLVSVLTNADYKDTLAVVASDTAKTVFAPTNDAFEAAGIDTANVDAVSDVLAYHVLLGAIVPSKDLAAAQAVTMANGVDMIIRKTDSGVTANDANVVIADVQTTDGVVHVVDKVIMPPASTVDTAASVDDLSVLVSVLTMRQYKPVLDAIASSDPKTVFAPTNAAFEAAGVDINDVETVTKVLQYHAVGAKAYSWQLSDGQKIATLLGQEVTVSTRNGVKINDANVVIADVLTRDGVVHVIDKVLLPRL